MLNSRVEYVFGISLRRFSMPAITITPRRSMVFFAFRAIAVIIGSYIFVVLLAAACVYLPYLALDRKSVV